MQNKLEKLAINLSAFVKNAETHQDVYNDLSAVWKSQSDYFGNKKTSDLIKLVFYVYDYLNTGSFNNANKIIPDLIVSGLILRYDEVHEETCPSCDGSGTITCDYCNGEGKNNCDFCNGRGGEYDFDSNWEECDECNGEGENTCDFCSGKGYQYCQTCDGNEYIETNENIYEITNILSWSNTLNYQLEKSANKPIPAISVNRFIDIRNNYIILFSETTHFFSEFNLSYDDYYCIGTEEDLDNLFYTSNLKIVRFDAENTDFLQ